MNAHAKKLKVEAYEKVMVKARENAYQETYDLSSKKVWKDIRKHRCQPSCTLASNFNCAAFIATRKLNDNLCVQERFRL